MCCKHPGILLYVTAAQAFLKTKVTSWYTGNTRQVSRPLNRASFRSCTVFAPRPCSRRQATWDTCRDGGRYFKKVRKEKCDKSKLAEVANMYTASLTARTSFLPCSLAAPPGWAQHTMPNKGLHAVSPHTTNFHGTSLYQSLPKTRRILTRITDTMDSIHSSSTFPATSIQIRKRQFLRQGLRVITNAGDVLGGTDCPICWNTLDVKGGQVVVVISKCQHAFHMQCLAPWFIPDAHSGQHNTCPYCRKELFDYRAPMRPPGPGPLYLPPPPTVSQLTLCLCPGAFTAIDHSR
jgi:hypothetical protein